MKGLVLCFTCVAVVSLMLLRADAVSMPMCPDQCDRTQCPVVNCACGKITDDCNCCDVCRVCPNEACELLQGDACAEGYTCTHPEGYDYIQRMNNPGTCLPGQD